MKLPKFTYGLIDPFLFHVLMSVLAYITLDPSVDFYKHFAFELISPIIVIFLSGSFASKLISELSLSARSLTKKTILNFFYAILFLSIIILFYNLLSGAHFSNYNRMVAAKEFKILWILTFFFSPMFISYCICTFKNKFTFLTISPFILIFIQQLFTLSASAIAFPLLLYIRSVISLIAPYPFGMSHSSFLSEINRLFKYYKISSTTFKNIFLLLFLVVFGFFGVLYMYFILDRSTLDLFARVTSDSVGIYSKASFDLADRYVANNNLLSYILHPLSSLVGVRGYEVPLGAGMRDSLLLNGATSGVGSLLAAFTYSNDSIYLIYSVISTTMIVFLRNFLHSFISRLFKSSSMNRERCYLLLFQHIFIDYSLVATAYGEYSNFAFFAVCNLISILFLLYSSRRASGLTNVPLRF